MMKKLFMVTAVIEVGAGLALLCCASLTAALLLGASLDTPASLTVALLAFAGIGPRLVGIALWPAVALHARLPSGASYACAEHDPRE